MFCENAGHYTAALPWKSNINPTTISFACYIFVISIKLIAPVDKTIFLVTPGTLLLYQVVNLMG